MKTNTLVVVLAILLPPLIGVWLYFSGAFANPWQLLQPLPFAWLGSSVALWLLAALLFGLRPDPRPFTAEWSAVSKLFHWAIAVAILGTTALMYYIVNLGDLENDLELRAEYSRILQIHKSIGLAVLFLVVLRFAWNRSRRRPPMPEHMSLAAQRTAHVAHAALYLLMVLVPLAGWAASMTYGARTRFFDLFELPVWLPKNDEWAAILQPAHIYMAWGLLALVGLHAGAALWHHFVRRDATLVQMLPGSRPTHRSGSQAALEPR
ncbi:MAG TPA: cytochrome b [Steroidobacteraceae bacterium]|nr:cytochrome b [Steroidobacteraceae bacterium]